MENAETMPEYVYTVYRSIAMDRETVIRDLEYLVSFGGASQQSMVMQIATEALILLKEQEERIKILEHQIETITKWRANAGAFD